MKIASHSRFWLISGLLLADGLLFGLSNPGRVSSWLLAVGFVLMALTLYQLLYGLLKAADWYGLPGKAHRHRQARTLTGLVAGVIALQSIGELGRRDVLVLLPLALLAYLYMSYGKGKSPQQSPGT
jgi:hypothetical protein